MAYRILCAAMAIALASPLAAQDERRPQDPPQDVTDIDLDDLMKVHVTTAGRKAQALSDVRPPSTWSATRRSSARG